MLKWFGSFILASIGLLTAFCYIWRDAPAKFFEFLTAYIGINKPQQPIFFTVYDRLGPDQVSEVTDVYIEAQPIGQFQLGRQNSDGFITGSVPGPGAYKYHLQSRFFEKLQRGFVCEGAGVVHITAGATYSVRLLEKNDLTLRCVVDLVAVK